MVDEKKLFDTIKSIVKKGYVEHAEIIPRINHAGMPSQYADYIVALIKKYRLRSGSDFVERFQTLLKKIIDKIFTYLSLLFGAAICAELVAVNHFASTILSKKLDGFGSHLLFWMGIKTIEVSALDMTAAMGNMISATPEIIKGMIVGGIIGYFSWIIISRLISSGITESRINRDIRLLIKKFINHKRRLESL